MQEPLRLTRDPLLRAFARGEEVTLDTPFGFACRGCGHHCCVDMQILVSPPEAARILWHLERDAQLTARIERPWGTLQLGGSTGLPIIQLRFVPLDGALTRCPFLAPVFDARGVWQQMAWCGLRAARPAVCRLYPLGRIAARGGAPGGEFEYRIVERCPGFEPAGGEPLPPDYTPADGRTVRDWVTAQLDDAQAAEKAYYLDTVVPAFLALHLHAPTEDCASGQLNEAAALSLGREILYNPPPAPDNPDKDHATLMLWLEALAALAPRLSALLASGGAQ